MYFNNFVEDIGEFDVAILSELKSCLFDIDLTNPLFNRPEYCFRNGGRLILPMNFAEVINEEYYPYVAPLVELIQNTNHYSLRNTIPYRVEISIIQPGSNVLWHQDQHRCHKFSERIHIPVVTNDSVEFVSKWYLDDCGYKFSMKPGHIYRYNNRVPHTVKNPHDHFRCHVVVDFIHKGIFEFLLSRGSELLTGNVVVTPADEIFYQIVPNPTGVERVELTQDDLAQLENIKNYYLLQRDSVTELSREQQDKINQLRAHQTY